LKKALVVVIVMVLGLGLFASAQTWTGGWDTDISIAPTATEFSNFITSFDSDLDVTYAIGGWTFGMKADFSVGGMDGLDFEADGVIGAFTFDVDMDFEPMYTTAVTTVYTGLEVLDSGDADDWANTCLQTPSWKYTTKTVTTTYTPAFDDLTASVDVSIAGVSFNGLFFLESTDSDATHTYTSWAFAGLPQQVASGTGITAQTASQITVTPTTKVGTGWRATLSGSFAGATLTSYTYFNLYEKFYNAGNSPYAHDYVSNSLKKYGTIYSLACSGCTPFFYEEYILIEGLAVFGDCLTLDIGVDFTCCDFQWVGFLFKDIALGIWGVDFDMLIKFETAAKTVTFEPEITLESGCFTIAGAIDYTSTAGFSLDGISIWGISYTHTFDGVTVSFAQTWDYTNNPLIGATSKLTHHDGSYLYFWKPDVNAGTTAAIALTGDHAGQWVLTAISCGYQQATVYNKLSLDFDADGCCGGAFDLDVDTYFGSIKTYDLSAVYGTYYFDDDSDGIYESGEWVEYLGALYGYAEYDTAMTTAVTEPPTATAVVAASTACSGCDTLATDKSESSKLVGFYGAGVPGSSILGWVESDADIVFGIGSNMAIGLGIDVAWWGWENISFSFELTF